MNPQQASSLAASGHNPIAHQNRMAATNPDGWAAMKDSEIDPCVLHPCNADSSLKHGPGRRFNQENDR